MGFVLVPTRIVIDFEMSIHSACKTVWPHTDITGCRFHCTQAWIKKIRQLHLIKEYQSKTEIGCWLGRCFGMLFLNPDEVEDFFVDVLMADLPTDDSARKPHIPYQIR